MDWVRGRKLGHGSFGTVNLAISRYGGPLMAVKSCNVSRSSSLVREKFLLKELKDCPQFIDCHGDSFTTENGEELYNILLEYAPGGSLADVIKRNALPEYHVRRCTRALLKGLHYLHELGYAHCDIKPQNILLDSNLCVRIADLGLAKRIGDKMGKLRGTPVYMAPDVVFGRESGGSVDIWALGCVVLQMMTGGSVYNRLEPTWEAQLYKIAWGTIAPNIPETMSAMGKDFLRLCFVLNPSDRWTAEMLLRHPFVCGVDEDEMMLNCYKVWTTNSILIH